MELILSKNLARFFYCELCDYQTSRKSNLDNHNRSAKHLKEINGTNIKQKLSKS